MTREVAEPEVWRALTRELRRLGFARTVAEAATDGCPRVVVYEDGEVEAGITVGGEFVPGTKLVLSVQLWGDGHHRASHWLGGTMDTFPTGFRTVPGLLKALEHERTRRAAGVSKDASLGFE